MANGCDRTGLEGAGRPLRPRDPVPTDADVFRYGELDSEGPDDGWEAPDRLAVDPRPSRSLARFALRSVKEPPVSAAPEMPPCWPSDRGFGGRPRAGGGPRMAAPDGERRAAEVAPPWADAYSFDRGVPSLRPAAEPWVKMGGGGRAFFGGGACGGGCGELVLVGRSPRIVEVDDLEPEVGVKELCGEGW